MAEMFSKAGVPNPPGHSSLPGCELFNTGAPEAMGECMRIYPPYMSRERACMHVPLPLAHMEVHVRLAPTRAEPFPTSAHQCAKPESIPPDHRISGYF